MSRAELPRTIPVEPPIRNNHRKSNARTELFVKSLIKQELPRNVTIQLNILVPVGSEIIFVTLVK